MTSQRARTFAGQLSLGKARSAPCGRCALLAAALSMGLAHGTGRTTAEETAPDRTAPSRVWPQWRGPGRDGKSADVGLLKAWPEGGPRLLWSVDGLGQGWSSPSVVDGHVYVMGLVAGEEFLFAFGPGGEPRWRTACGAGWTKSNAGSRCQPTVERDRVYVITSMVRAACLDATTGRILWSRDAFADFGGVNRSYGNAESPLVVADKVIVTPGGSNATMVALHKDTGRTVWLTRDLRQPAAYCSPILVERGGTPIVVTMVKEGAVGVDARDGTVLWTASHRNKYDNHMVSPAFEDGLLYVTSGYGAGGKMFRLSDDGRSLTKLWEQRKPDTMHGGVIFVGGHIYGSSNTKECGGGDWICLDAHTGEVVYQKRWVKAGSVTCAEGNLYCYGEDGQVALVPARPDAAAPLGRFTVAPGTGQHYAHPVVCDGRLYIRRGDVLAVYGISEP